jgi:hypothetical protein
MYDFSISDGSFFQFRHSKDALNFTYYECPYFVNENLSLIRENYFGNDYYSDALDIYEFFFDINSESKSSATPIRYDFDHISYATGRHPVSHFHFGFENQMRLACDKILSPIPFLFFILRQRYPEYWISFMNSKLYHVKVIERNEFINHRKHLRNIDRKSHWSQLDDLELFLT